MKAKDVILTLEKHGIQLFLRDGKLRSRAPKGALTKERQELIRAHKEAIVAMLSQIETASGPVAPAVRPEVIPLSHGQKQLWFLDQLEGPSATYNQPTSLRIEGRLDRAALERALEGIVARHEILRTTFRVIDGAPAQEIHETIAFRLAEEDASEEAIETLATEEAQRPFDLEQGPLFRARLIRISEEIHILLITMHHTVSDAWSMGVLVRELLAFYTALREGAAPNLPALPLQYADYACWQQQQEADGQLARQAAYWRERLEGLPPLLELPTDHPRPQTQSYRGGLVPFSFSETLSRRLADLAREQRASLFMVLLAGFQMLLARYTRREDIAVSSPVANRANEVLEQLIGFFVNSVVLRNRVSSETTFRAFLEQVRTHTLGAFANQDIPFEQLVRELRPQRSASHAPIAQVRFILQNAPREALEIPGLRFSPVGHDLGVAKFDLLLVMTEYPDGIGGLIQYNSDLFREDTVARMADHLRVLLEGAVADPEAGLGSLPLLPAAERDRLLTTWALGDVHPFPETTVHDRFFALAASFPERAAVVEGDALWSHADIAARTRALVAALSALEGAPRPVIGLCMKRSPEFVVAMLAVMASGAAYVPLDPDQPADRLDQIVAQAGLDLVLVSAREAEVAGLAGLQTLAVSVTEPVPSATPTPIAVHSQQPAYVIFTSGSTGLPKGVAVTHANLLAYVTGVLPFLDLDDEAVLATLATVAADLGNTALFGALCSGRCLRILPRALELEPDALAAHLERHPVDCLKIVPSHLAVLLNAARPARLLPRACLVSGGEALEPGLIARIRELAPALRIVNHYGPTEATIGILAHRVTAQDEGEVPIGRPFANCLVRILDERQQLVPSGLPGELYLGGALLAQGYVGQPALTAERFVPDPFSSSAGARLYRTGDLVRQRDEGRVVFRGRADHQVKVRGFRVEPEEIAAVLRTLTDVADAVVITREHEAQGLQLLAYAVAHPGAALDADALRRHLGRRLPDYMVPASLMVLERLPITPNGKVDRDALPTPTVTTTQAFTAPRTPLEETIAAIWCDVLGLEQLSVHDNFFELGGHSLLATLVVVRIREALTGDLEIRTLFDAPTVAGLAEALAAGGDAGEDDSPPMVRVSREEPIPLSFAQQRLWFLDKLRGADTTYNMFFALRLRGPLEVDLLIAAFGYLIDRHEVLRTRFAERNGAPVQIIDDDLGMVVPIVPLSGLSPQRRAALAQDWLAAEAGRPFDLAGERLIRVTLLRLAEEEHHLLVNMNHIVCDGWSIRLLQRELGMVYGALLAAEPIPLARLPLQYADFAAWQRKRLSGTALAEQMDYWKENLAGLDPVLELPTDFPRPAVRRHRGASMNFLMSPSLSSQLLALGRDRGATPFMTLLAGLELLLAGYTGRGDLAIGTSIANRNRRELEGMVGFFINTLIIRARIAPEDTFGDLLEQVRDQTLSAFAHQDVPFEQVIDTLEMTRSLSHEPMGQVRFMFRNLPEEKAEAATPLKMEALQRVADIAKFDLLFVMTEQGDSLQCGIQFDRDLYREETVARIWEQFRHLMEQVAADPDRRLGALSLAPPEERAALLRLCQSGPSGEPVFLHERVARTARDVPERPALVHEDGVIGYGDLNATANRLAHRLLAGRHGGLIGLCLPRCPALVTAQLATLKAGAAYVPIDPAYPAARTRAIIEQAGIALVLTRADQEENLPEEVTRWHLDDHALLAEQPDTDPERSVAPADLVYVIFTSGSTGVPKGVCVGHGALSAYVDAVSERLDLTPEAHLTALSTVAADLGNTALFGALGTGRTLRLIPEHASLDPEVLAAILSAEPVGCLKIVPGHLAALLSGTRPEAILPRQCLVLGGEALTTTLTDRIRRLAPDLRIINHYGPTEATIGILTHAVRPDGPAPAVPIGLPLTGSQAYVCDPAGRLLPAGVSGELVLGGAQLARGYLNDPRTTAERFVPDALGSDPGARLYRTGDRVVLRPESGGVTFVGRLDHQVKIRGFRVEPGEVTTALLAEAAVADAVVVIREDVPEQAVLTAYYVAEPGSEPTQTTLAEALRQRLPDYMVPSVFVRMAAIPLTPNGKIDREALPRPAVEEGASATYTAPRNPVETALAEIWCDVLNREQVGIHDNFFRLGGDSILSILVISRANQQGLGLTPKMLYERQTIAELAEATHQAPRIVAEQGLVSGSVPLSPVQKRFLMRDSESHHHYNQSMLLHLPEAPRREPLERALRLLEEHHDALRLRFETVPRGWVQWLEPPGTPALGFHDLSGIPAEERAAALEELATAAQAGLDLLDGPIFRAEACDMGESGRLLLIVHHLAVDGVSWSFLLEDLKTAYEAFANGETPTLPPKTSSIKAWVERLTTYAHDDAVLAELDSWRRLAEVPRDDLPVDRAGVPTAGTLRAHTVALDSEATTRLLERVPEAYRTHIDDVLLTALASAVGAWTGGRRLWVDLEGHGREPLFDDLDPTRTVGWFTTIYPLLLALPEDDHPGARLMAVKEQIRAVPAKGIGYGLLRYLNRDPRVTEAMAAIPEPQIQFNYLGQTDRGKPGNREPVSFGRALESAGPNQAEGSERPHLLTVTGRVADGQLVLYLRYAETVYDEATMVALGGHLERALHQIIDHCCAAEAGGLTPSDFPEASCSQEWLDRLAQRIPPRRVAGIYPLSPLQRGMLYHSVLEPESGVYLIHQTYEVSGDLDAAAFREAWEQVVAQHGVLRTLFLDLEGDRPLQVVLHEVDLPWQDLDWRGLSREEQETRLERLLAEARRSGFDPARAPLMRLFMIRLDADRNRIVWLYHHAITDGWSTGRIRKQVMATYEALRAGRVPERETVRPFRDYIRWLTQQDMAAAEAYWRETLAGVNRPTPLGLVRGAPARRPRPARRVQLLSEEATTALATLARRESLTLNILTQAAWALTLSRYSGMRDVVFGTTVAARPVDLAGVETMIGPFINTVPLRTRIGAPVLTWLKELHAAQVTRDQYSFAPLVDIHRWSEVPGDQPLFETLLVFENRPPESRSSHGGDHEVTITDVAAVSQTSYPITLALAPGPSLWVQVNYDENLFAAPVMARLLEHYTRLMEGLARHPEALPGALLMLTEAEKRVLLVDWNDTAADHPVVAPIHRQVLAWSERSGEATALGFEDSAGEIALSYAQLRERSARLADLLAKKGVGPGHRVAVCLPRTPGLMVAMLAVLRRGAAYVPIDPGYPEERRTFLLEDCGATVRIGGDGIALDAAGTLVDTDAPPVPDAEIDVAAPAYVIYTSGSTGRPKGTVIAHSALHNLVHWHRRTYAVTAEDRASQTASQGFDACVWETWPYLTAGAALLITPDAVLKDPEQLFAWFARNEITLCFLATPLAEAILRLPEVRNWHPRAILTGGDRLTTTPPEAWGSRLINHYGPTEAAVVTTAGEVMPEGVVPPPIGRPIDHFRVCVVGEDLTLQPIGIAGELLIGGRGLAQGYLDRPALTAAAFIPNPFADGASVGSRLYRSGDRVRYLEDGQIAFLGRIDQQLSLRGYRIEPGEIEAALRALPAVAEAVVLIRNDVRGVARLVATVQPTGAGHDPQRLEAELVTALQTALPSYMVPSHYVFLDTMPLNPNGKIDRDALPEPDWERAETDAYVPPQPGAETVLAEIWQSLLKVARVGRNDNFFSLGGDSIISLQVISRARAEGLALRPVHLFELQTLSAIAAAARPADEVAVVAEQELLGGEVPLTPIQAWFFDSDHPTPQHWNQSLFFRVAPGVDLERLGEAVKRLVHHHDALRMRFEQQEDGSWKQFMSETVSDSVFAVVALGADADAAAITEAAAGVQSGFDLAEGPLWRAVYLDLGEARSGRILLAAHHLVVDGVTWRVLLQDLQSLYDGLASDPEHALPAKTTSFRTWSQKLAERADSEHLREEAAWWMAQLGRDIRPLPKDGAGEPGAASLATALTGEQTRALLQEATAAYRTRINDLLLCSLAMVLCRWTEGEAVAVALEGHGREPLFADVDLSRTAGWFTALFPLVLTPGEGDPGTLIKAIKEQIRALPDNGIGYGLLRYLSSDASIGARLAELPSPEVSFNYLGQLDAAAEELTLLGPAPESAGPGRAADAKRPFSLEISARVVDGCLHLGVTYLKARVAAGTAERLLDALREALVDLIDHCVAPAHGGATPTDFPLWPVTQAQMDQLLSPERWRRVADAYPLSPLQEGMLFHALYRPEEQTYFEQLTCDLHGELDLVAFTEAWRATVARHEILRTGFFTAGLPDPVQIVFREVDLPIRELDWRALSEDARAQRLQTFLDDDRAQGFRLDEPPLMRLALIQMGDDHCHLVWSRHHLLIDGWCSSLLVQEVFRRYRANQAGKPYDEPAPRPYRDYIAWLSDQDRAAAESFWRGYLQGLARTTDLRVKPKPDGAVTHTKVNVLVPSEQIRALEALARSLPVTLNTIVQAAWGLLLSRYDGNDDVLFGVTSSGRPPELTGISSMLGVFMNTLPFRVTVPPSKRLGDWFLEIQDHALAMRDFEYSRLVDIQHWSGIDHGHGLFESLLIFENYPVDKAARRSPGNLTVTNVAREEQGHYPLSLIAVPGEHMRLTFFYDVSRYDRATIDRIAGHLQQILQTMTAHPEIVPAEISLLTEAEQEQLLRTWNASANALPEERYAHRQFALLARTQGDRTALIFGEEAPIGYGALNARVNRLAHHLAQRGVVPGMVVGICLERGVDVYIALLAVSKCGAAYLPLDPSWPGERLAFMLGDAQPAALITRESAMDALPAFELNFLDLLLLEEVAPLLEDEPDDDPEVTLDPALPAYLIYTSGSTGQPKGVVVTHAGLPWVGSAYRDLLAVTPESRVLQFASVNFDASVAEIWTALYNGAALVSGRTEDLLPGPDLAGFLERHRITHVSLPPSAAANLPARDYPDLVCVLVAGEACPAALVARLAPGRRLINAYGPTEATICNTMALCEPAETPPPIGHTLAHQQTHLLDPAGRLVPIGIPGELHIGGRGLASGYLNQPALTAARFLPDPFGDEPGARLYRTGDLGYRLADGQIVFQDRVDSQVKIRGYRIELGEIEHTLLRSPLIREAAVIDRVVPRSDRAMPDHVLTAYVVPENEDGGCDAAHCRDHLRESLPEYMIPAGFVFLASLPHTPAGKIDRRTLPDPSATHESASRPPRTPTEELVADIWSDVLGSGAIDIDTDFFETGGHSLLATQVISRVNACFGLNLPVVALFDATTIEKLARAIEADLGNLGEQQMAPITPADRDRPLPLSFGQERLWVLDRIEGGNAAYSIPMALSLEGVLDVAALGRAISEIIRRHEILRTRFLSEEGVPRQEITPAEPVPLTVEHLDDIAEDERLAAARDLAAREAAQPFDLATGPLFRVRLLALAPEHHVLLVTMHHIVSDGWSRGVLVDELSALYRSFRAGEASPLPELPLQYADFATWQRTHLEGALDDQRDYWREKLGGELPVLRLPTDHPETAAEDHRGAVVSHRLDPEVGAALRAMGQKQGATLFMTVLAAWKLLLYRHTGEEDLIVGTPIAGRTRRELESSIGFFLNTLALRTDLSGAPTFAQLLARVRQATLEAFGHQDLPFERLVELCQPRRRLTRNPIFDVMFNFGNNPAKALELPGLRLANLGSSEPDAKFFITLYASEQEGSLSLSLVYKRALFSGARMAHHLRQLAWLLEQVATDPDRSLEAYSLVDPQSLPLLPDPAEALTRPYHQPLPERIRDVANENPEAIALRQHGQDVTYAALRDHAAALTRLLMARGIERGDVVAVYGSRCPVLISAMLAAMASGGVLLTLDPNLPRQRRALMLTESGARLMLAIAGAEDAHAGTEIEVVALDEDPASLPVTSAETGAVTLDQEDPAYIFFTSGTTRVPRAVLGKHGGLAHFIDWQRETFAIGPGDRAAQLTALSFDVVMRDVFTVLSAGGTLCLPPSDALIGSGKVLHWLAEERVTLCHLVPSITATWLVQPPEGVALDDLRLIFFAGEPLRDTLLRRWRTLFPRSGSFVNIYGPTETTLAKCFHRLEGEPEHGVQPVGRPLPDTQVLVLRPDGSHCGFDEPGELVIRTPFRSLGYLRPSEREKDRFAVNPHTGDPDDLCYHTGDRGCLRHDGLLQVLGRMDFQVKIRGVRIDPAEIESLLADHPSVKQAVVRIVDVDDGDRLVAYVLPEERAADRLPLRPWLAERLPEALVPDVFVSLERFPLLPNGKVDRRALPLPDPQVPAATDKEPTPPRNDLELRLVTLWQDILQVPNLGIDDNFFERGGHSLLAMRLVDRIHESFGVQIPAVTVFQTPTIAELAEQIRTSDTPTSLIVPIQPGDSRPPLYLLHYFGGTVFSYWPLARELGEDQPVYGLQSPAFFDRSLGGPLPVLAKHCVAEIQIHRPEGPILLGGWSFGGLVAFEVARQLREAGREIRLLVLFDTASPHNEGGVDDDLDGQALHQLVRQHQAKIGREIPVTRDELVATPEDQRLDLVMQRAEESGLPLDEATRAELRQIWHVIRVNMAAKNGYEPKHYPGRLVFFQALAEDDEGSGPRERATSWSALAGDGVDLYDVVADHEDMMDPPHVAEIAARLRPILEKTLGQPAS